MYCLQCSGKGYIIFHSNKCQFCAGTGDTDNSSRSGTPPGGSPPGGGPPPSAPPMMMIPRPRPMMMESSPPPPPKEKGETMKLKKCYTCKGLGGIPEQDLLIRDDKFGHNKISGYLIKCETCKGKGFILSTEICAIHNLG